MHDRSVDKLDAYAGDIRGFNTISVKEISDNPNGFGSAESSQVGFSTFAGGRYYFMEILQEWPKLATV